MSRMVVKKILPTLAAALVMASVTAPARADDGDPLEPMNRVIFDFNQVTDTYLIRPVALGYRYITPQTVRTHIGNVSDNLYEPINMVNSLLQGDLTQTFTTMWRFIINTTVGLGGINDVASEAGLARRSEDFGQTLASWGIGSGPYIVLPILGPSNLRDTTGRVADYFANPVHYYLESDEELALAIGQGLVTRERWFDPIDDAYNGSIDPYSTFRSMYEQRRARQISNGQGSDSSFE
jgi:phospholipid-binding lipoprotein MlaA